MNFRVQEVHARSILSKSGIPGVKYCINPYTGCTHSCRYCYATFMKRLTGHNEPWGSFVDVKINTSELLRRQLRRAGRGTIMLSSVTDPYQSIETRYKLTRKCLELLKLYQFPVTILTKSPLVTRDIDIISKINDAEVGLTITTDDENMRKVFEPGAHPVATRVETLKKLHNAGINTYVFIGPILPMNPESLAKMIKPYVNSILIDKMNYVSKTKGLYKKHMISKWLDEKFTEEIVCRLKKVFEQKNVQIC
jgi:DNA repair photolyase